MSRAKWGNGTLVAVGIICVAVIAVCATLIIERSGTFVEQDRPLATSAPLVQMPSQTEPSTVPSTVKRTTTPSPSRLPKSSPPTAAGARTEATPRSTPIQAVESPVPNEAVPPPVRTGELSAAEPEGTEAQDLEPQDIEVCPSGSVRAEIESVDVGPPNSTGMEHIAPDLVPEYENRPLTVKGSITNGTSHPVVLEIMSDVWLTAIDARGEEVFSVQADYTYLPPPGQVRPLEIVLQPGEVAPFEYLREDQFLSFAEWREVRYVAFDSYYAFVPHVIYVDYDAIAWDCWADSSSYGYAPVDFGKSHSVTLK